MKNLLAIVALIAFSASAFADKVGPYLYTYSGSPVSAPVTAINPPPGSMVIDTTTGVHYRKVSAIGSNATYAIEPVKTVVSTTPLTGATITANAASDDQYHSITPAGTIAELTFVFPSNANSRLGQEITLHSTQIVTALTISAAGQTVTTTTELAANVPARFIKTAASVWTRIANVATDSGVVLTASVITDGLTASGSASNDFSASTGTFKTSTGANTIGGDATVAAGKDLLFATGDGAADFSLGTGVTKTTTGIFTIGGATVFAANKGVTVDAGTSAFDLSGGTGVTKTTTGLFTVSGGAALSTTTLSGAGAISVVKGVTKITTTGVDDALTLANGTDGQIVTIVHDVDGGSAILTPTTKTGFTTITFTNVGESATLVYVTTRGWIIVALNGAVAA